MPQTSCQLRVHKTSASSLQSLTVLCDTTCCWVHDSRAFGYSLKIQKRHGLRPDPRSYHCPDSMKLRRCHHSPIKRHVHRRVVLKVAEVSAATMFIQCTSKDTRWQLQASSVGTIFRNPLCSLQQLRCIILLCVVSASGRACALHGMACNIPKAVQYDFSALLAYLGLRSTVHGSACVSIRQKEMTSHHCPHRTPAYPAKLCRPLLDFITCWMAQRPNRMPRLPRPPDTSSELPASQYGAAALPVLANAEDPALAGAAAAAAVGNMRGVHHAAPRGSVNMTHFCMHYRRNGCMLCQSCAPRSIFICSSIWHGYRVYLPSAAHPKASVSKNTAASPRTASTPRSAPAHLKPGNSCSMLRSTPHVPAAATALRLLAGAAAANVGDVLRATCALDHLLCT